MKIYKQDEIDKLAEILRTDGVISVPTDTVYGVCARMNSKQAHDNLIKIKNRPLNKLFPIMCSDEEQIKSIAIVNKTAEKIIRYFMPGPITLVLEKKQEIPEYINNGQKTIAIRMATSQTIKELIKKIESPIFMSSANQSGESVCTNLEEIEKECPMLDGMLEGKVTFGQPSTIIDCTTEKIKILRNGPISLEKILKKINEEEKK